MSERMAATQSSRNPESERLYWPSDEIAQYQLDRLRETVTAAKRSAHYGPLLSDVRLESLDDLSTLPLTTKDDVRSASPFGLVAVDRQELFQYHESFGTTGTPASGWLTRGDLENYAAQINQTAVNLNRDDRILVRFPYAISVPAHIVTQAARNRDACVIPASSRTAVSPHTRIIELLEKLEATVIGCLPMEAIFLAETARLMGRDPAHDFPHLRAICTAGELLSDARRQRIADLWDVRVFNMYGCTEAGNIAADCDHGRLHLSWDHFLLEVLDETNWQPVAPGEMGTAVLTTLTREAMPVLRYVLGDNVRLHSGHDCPCGRQSPIIEHFGRDLNRFDFAGKSYFVKDLEEVLLLAPVRAVGNLWLIEVRSGEVRFRVEAEHPDAELYRSLEKQIREAMDLPLRIDAVTPGSLLDRSRLMKIDAVNKPRIVGIVPNNEAPPLTLDDLM
ncbi:MAG: phenylacetate--CoA ligase family protein [Planctomycetes bacterium]|nr:phenylacetate--CoA ligase family protein [Planctomycetota bacterium]